MLRIIALSAVAVISVGISAANAELPSPPSKKSPGEIATVSRLLVQKQENCRLEAKLQKLTFFKRRSFIRKCMKNRT
jgi:epoxyqueuosine reductase QueG